MSSLHLYIKPGCPWCTDAVAWLDDRGYSYQSIDVLADRSAFAEMEALSGQSLAPTLVVGRDGKPEDQRVLPDFGVQELEVFLEKHGIRP